MTEPLKTNGATRPRMRRRAVLESVFAGIGALFVVAGVVASFDSYAIVGSGLIGFGSALLVTWVLALAARPSLTIEPARDKYDFEGTKWVHLAVRNVSSGFLSGGEANECRATLVFDEGNRRFEPKWAGRPNPHRLQMIPALDGQHLGLITDEHLYDSAKVQALPPDNVGAPPELLDVAFKFPGSKFCYISVPEHFRGAGLNVFIETKPERAFGEGKHPFTVEIRNRGQVICTKRFILVNEKGTGPEGLRIETLA